MPRPKKPANEVPDTPNDNLAPDNRPFYVPDDAKWGGFLNFRLTEDDADEFHLWFQKAQAEAGWILLDEAIRAGIKLSVTYDFQNNTFIATFTGDLLRIKDRRSMSSRAPYWAQAVLLQVFKHSVLLQGDYSRTVTPSKDWKSFG